MDHGRFRRGGKRNMGRANTWFRPSGPIPDLELSCDPQPLHPPPTVAVLDTLLPVFLIIALGAALTKSGWLAADFLKGLNRLAYWIGLPCLLFASVSNAEELSDRPWHIFLVLLAGTLAAGCAGWAAARVLGMPRAAIGTFVQGTFRGNLALLALPVTIYAFGAEVVPVVALAIAPLMILYNIFAAIVLLASQDGADRPTKRAFARQLLLHPLVLAILAGLIASRLDVALPPFVSATIHTIGGLAVPLALLGIGGTLVLSPVRAHVRPAVVGAMIKVALTPLVGVLLARAVGFPPDDVRIVGIMLASPTAAASFVMAAQMKGDAALASSLVVVTTFLSIGSLSFVLIVL